MPRTDTERLEWVMDVLSLGDDTKADRKAVVLGGAILQGKTGRDAIDSAMDAMP